MKRFGVLCSALFVLMICFGLPAGAKVYIDINSPGATKLPLLVPPFRNLGGPEDAGRLAADMPRVIESDLVFTGFFRAVDPEALNASVLNGMTRDKVRWDLVSVLGAEAIITGGITVSPGGDLSAELRLFDTVRRDFIAGKKYRGQVGDARLIAHRFANEVYREITGERGVFTTRIAFVCKRGDAKELCIMDYDGGNITRLTDYRSLSLSPAWSPDGSRLAFTSYRAGNPDLYIKDIYSGKTRRVSHKKGVNISPAWSPDGKKIALTLSLNNGNSEIYTIAVNSGKLERLTRNWATDVSPVWSPDGTRIAFVSSRAGGPQIYCLTVGTRRIKRLTYSGNYNTSPAWSPDGEFIAYTGIVDGKFQIRIASVDGSFSRQLTAKSGNNEDPSWSPDGRYITFSSTRNGTKQIYIMRSDGTGQRQITFGGEESADPAWSPY